MMRDFSWTAAEKKLRGLGAEKLEAITRIVALGRQ
jgi:hypothetical protein